jgi:hypothetical protein
MKRKDILLLACLLPFTSGLINSMGLYLFELVTTNVAGHFGTFLQQLMGLNYAKGLILLGGVGAYALGAFGATLSGEMLKKAKFSLLIPVLLNVLILSFLQFIPFKNGHFAVMWLLFGGMGAYNAFASNLTNGQVKPSQLTGLLIDACVDTAKIASKKYPIITNADLRKKNQVRWLVIAFFSLGVVVNVALQQSGVLAVVRLPLLFLLIVTSVLAIKIV